MGKYKYKNILTKEFLLRSDISGMSITEIGKMLDIDPCVIWDYRNLYGLDTQLTKHCQKATLLREHSIPDWQKGLLIGMLLGDGNLTTNKQGNIRFRTQHCDRQKDYVVLKRKLLDNLCVGNIKTYISSQNGKTYHSFSTIWHSDLKYLYDIVYDSSGRKIVTQEALDLLTIPGLVLWYYDDGSADRYLATCSFNLNEVKLIRQHLFRKFGIKTTPVLQRDGDRKYYYLYFSKDTGNILGKFLSDYYLSCFDYKIKTFVGSSETLREALWEHIPKMKIKSDLISNNESATEMIAPSEKM
ncbi:MAG: hypothetical protein MUO85_01075 [candidate division Zixibacteria bacterium]|nr:hypothetical protein [candidate division Zixibacteria bacterium]